jgi:PAS domain S-box-containing protein
MLLLNHPRLFYQGEILIVDEQLIPSNPLGAILGASSRIDAGDESARLDMHAVELETIIDNIPEALVVTDPGGRLLYVNQAVEAILGRPMPEIELEDWPEKIGFFLDDAKTHFPGDRMPLVRALGGEIVDAEEMILTPANQTNPIWVSMAARPIQDKSGEVTGAIVLFRDITYRKQIQLSRESHALRMEALYRFSRAIAESGNDLTSIAQIIAVHAAENIGDACILTLLNPHDNRLRIMASHHPKPENQAILRKHIMSIDHDLAGGILGGVIESGEPLLIPTLSPEHLDAITLPEFTGYILETGSQGLMIIPIVGRSGTFGTISLFRDPGRKPYSVNDQSFITDLSYRAALAIENCRLFDSLREQITERLSANDALSVSEERSRSIFESTTLGIKVLDLSGTILQTNPAFKSMIGYSEEELVGRFFYSFVHAGDVARTIRMFNGLKENGGRDFRLEHRALHKDGSVVWVKTTFTKVKKGGGDDSLAFVVGILENTTEQKRTQLEMAELKNRLQGSREMERLHLAQELHDGPMQELYSSIYQIEEIRAQSDPRHQGMLEMVRKDIQKVLDELRAMAKELRPPTLDDFGLENAISSYLEDFQEKHPGILVQANLAQDHQRLPSDVRLALFRILQVSLANVVRHSEANKVEVRFAMDAELATLELVDNGKGFEIPENWMGLVRKGHYGLAGAAERIEALGGSFSVDSTPGEGTTVRAEAPLTESAD